MQLRVDDCAFLQYEGQQTCVLVEYYTTDKSLILISVQILMILISIINLWFERKGQHQNSGETIVGFFH